MKLGNPVLGNIIMIGAVSGMRVIPLEREDFGQVIAESLPAEKQDLNLQAFDIGSALLSKSY